MSKIKDLKENVRDTIVCIVIECTKGITNSHNAYLNLVLQDNTGKIDAKKWDASEKDMNALKVGNVLSLLVDPIIYKGQMQLKIIDFDELKGPIDQKELIINPPVSTTELETELHSFISEIQDQEIRTIVTEILQNYYDQFLYHPAAKSNHHEYASGLLHHEVSMLKLAKAIIVLYPEIQKDLLYGGIILHDLGKIKELSGPITTEYTTAGKLLGHISIIQTDIIEVAKKHQITEEKVMLLQHMVLAHHGKYEYGSPVLPHTLEAEVLYLIDNMDSRIHMIIKALNNVEVNSFTNKIPALEGRAFYKHK
ncbi:nucleic acid-binding domain protein [Firmicutes bacterium CAG:631]|nr:nucleic acid-binding domain protein [Firmicutes bacterium CAG:631]